MFQFGFWLFIVYYLDLSRLLYIVFACFGFVLFGISLLFVSFVWFGTFVVSIVFVCCLGALAAIWVVMSYFCFDLVLGVLIIYNCVCLFGLRYLGGVSTRLLFGLIAVCLFLCLLLLYVVICCNFVVCLCFRGFAGALCLVMIYSWIYLSN